MSDDELEAWAEDQLAQEAQDIAILQNEIAMEGEELAEMEHSAELTSSEIHFMDMFQWVKPFWILYENDWCITSSYL